MGTADTVLTEDERAVVKLYRAVADKGKAEKINWRPPSIGLLHEVDTKDLINKMGGKG